VTPTLGDLLTRLALWDLGGRLIGTCPSCMAGLLRGLLPDLDHESDEEIAQRWDELLDALATGADPAPILTALIGADLQESR